MENELSKVRLDLKSILLIKDTAKKIFGKSCKVYLFGSRADIKIYTKRLKKRGFYFENIQRKLKCSISSSRQIKKGF